MKLRNMIILIVGGVFIFGSTLYASGDIQSRIISSLEKIELQKNQNDKINQFKQEQQQEIKNGRTQLPEGRLFSKDGFNKKFYIERGEAIAKIRIDASAKFIEKTFSILSNKQKVELLKAMQAKN